MAFQDPGADETGPDPGSAGPGADAGPGPDAGGGGGPPAPPPPGGGPVLAALARRNMSPPVSAPGPGNMAQGLMMLKQAVDMIHSALPNLDAGSQPHKDAVKALTSITRHLPQGAPTAGVQQTQIGDMLRNTLRNALLQKLMQQRSQPGAKPDGGPQSGTPGMPTQPAPSLPLPGA